MNAEVFGDGVHTYEPEHKHRDGERADERERSETKAPDSIEHELPTSLVALRSDWRREALRTNLWLVPTIEVIAALALYFATHALDKSALDGSLTLPSWMVFGTADAARQILTTLAAAVITVVGVVFSITIVTLTLASTQVGPRMLRKFIRDRGTQFTLGTFVATFVYVTLVLISIGPASHGQDFVPPLSITIAVGLVTLCMGVLIYFIHHIAMSIQLPHVIASIATDLSPAIDAESSDDGVTLEAGPSVAELLRRMDDAGGTVPAPSSGYLQFIQHELSDWRSRRAQSSGFCAGRVISW